ncbi:hypothetical protein MNB_SV-15-211 [hydrothermal vent metagenome]|uniref:FecR protein domain-containing protein n=1 Tax=hydrothermal vent metagenome TaxID=652676 RepID=A0A1W1EJK8_9ZZZZ
MIKIFSLIFLINTILLANNIGTIMALKGSASIQRVGTNINAKSGMSILNGDSINTDNNSRVQIVLKDDTTLTIGANSSFEFTKFYFDGTKKSSLKMRANRGFFRSVTGKIGKIAPNRFKLKTISATIGIRGTDFSGNIMENREVIRCYSGAISVELDKGGINDILSGMLIEITDKKVNIKKHMKALPFEKVIYKAKRLEEKVSDITQEFKREEELPCKPYEVEE